MRLSISRVGRLLLLLIFVFLLVNRIQFLSSGKTSTPLGLITGHSMEPTLVKGNIIIWYPAPASSVKVGDVIVYQSYVNDDLAVTHRVVEVKEKKGGTYFVTKGDNNPYLDQVAPTAPEPEITGSHYLGKVVSVGQRPVPIPFVGEMWYYFTAQMSGEVAEFPWVSFVVIALVMAVGSSLSNPQKKKAKEDKEEESRKMTDIVFGPEDIRLRRIAIYSIVVYTTILLFASYTLYDKTTTTLGVNETPQKGAHMDFGKMTAGETRERNATMILPSTLFPYKIVMFYEGEDPGYVEVSDELFVMQPREQKEFVVTGTVPYDAIDGVYHGTIVVHSSTFWLILPDEFMDASLQNMSPSNAILVFDTLSAFILTVTSITLAIVVSKAIDLYVVTATNVSWLMDVRTYKRKLSFAELFPDGVQGGRTISGEEKGGIRAKLLGWASGLDWNEVGLQKPIYASLVAIPFIPIFFWGDVFAAVLLAALSAGALAYFLGCRWRAEIILSGLLSLAIIMGSCAVISFGFARGTLDQNQAVAYLANAGAAFSILSFLFLAPVALLAYMGGLLPHKYLERNDPAYKLELCDL